jgi:NADH-quinone oxidoreductase subunit C
MTAVDREQWPQALAELRLAGFASLDFLTAVDRGDQLEVVARVVDPSTGTAELVTTRVPSDDPVLPTVTAELPAAGWHERETAEMFGVVFVGHPDLRPLLLGSAPFAPPLRRSTPLVERTATPWPGAVDDGGRARRRQLPPGVQPEWVEADHG